MMLNLSTPTWMAFSAAVADHLWQSTLVLIIAGLLMLTLRKNQARVRYWLWVVASAKFLLPFALLVRLGSHLAGPRSNSIGTDSGFTFAMEQVSQPFAPSAIPVDSPVAHSTAYLNSIHLLPMALLAVWLCGFISILFLWCRHWRWISVVIREAVPLHEGRELEALRRQEHTSGIRKPITLLLSRASLEPGIFGIRQPVLIWPAGISGRLEDAQLDAILAHELCHVRCRDNLTAMMHMAVEAIFWFHPLVWWLGARLVEERERACDEEVLRSGSEPQAYAEGILNVCKFYTESPLTCVSGVTGGNLKRRILRVMTQPLAGKLSSGRKLLLAGIGIAAFAVPFVFGLLKAPRVQAQMPQVIGAPVPSFEVISIRPNHSGGGGWRFDSHDGRFTITDASTKAMIQYAYNLKDFQLSGGPDWSHSEKYNIDLQEKAMVSSVPGAPYGGELGAHGVVQALLADRFKLKLNKETKEMPVYALVVAQSGPKLLQETTTPVHYSVTKHNGKLAMIGVATDELADSLSEQLNRLVVDKTGLKGVYDFTLQWTPGSKISLDTALQQLGLKLEPQTGPVTMFVIDHVEKPTEN